MRPVTFFSYFSYETALEPRQKAVNKCTESLYESRSICNDYRTAHREEAQLLLRQLALR